MNEEIETIGKFVLSQQGQAEATAAVIDTMLMLMLSLSKDKIDPFLGILDGAVDNHRETLDESSLLVFDSTIQRYKEWIDFLRRT